MDNLMEELIELRKLLPNSVWLIIPSIIINDKLCIRAEWYGNEKHGFEQCFFHSEIRDCNYSIPIVFAGKVNIAVEESIIKDKGVLR